MVTFKIFNSDGSLKFEGQSGTIDFVLNNTEIDETYEIIQNTEVTPAPTTLPREDIVIV